ncbi:MAG: 4-hydroxythreonine-4-phosphate dehydrogenase PdxA [Bacteroidales bacterium]|nr:4-hydroxythreonine-4-phosphate dehydrogenase PdxA [Bacteroidales bacterium]
MGQKIIIGITLGDTNGIGPEVVIKSLQDSRITDLCIPIIYGSSRIIGFYRKAVADAENLNTNIINSAKDFHPKRINIINCIPDSLQIDPGQPTPESANAALLSLERATDDLKEGLLDAVVTAPFNKSNMADASFQFKGHTEYLANKFEAEHSLMFLCSEKMRVGLVTTHTSIADVSKEITIDKIVEKLRVMNESLKRDFGVVRPQIAVLGLNPHCGDNGLLGDEEQTIIKPAIERVLAENILAFGPYSPDGFYGNNSYTKFDGVLAMYHDQGLIPFKLMSFDTGVNFTAGLPVVRTSPDHGTAFELVTKNEANALPMLSSIYMAIDVVKNRRSYDEMRSNVLKVRTFMHGKGTDNVEDLIGKSSEESAN